MTNRGEAMQSKVLAVLRRRRRPLSAYGVLRALQAEAPKLAPPTIYRALTALMARGLVHRLESENAYLACRAGADAKTAILSICDDCGLVEETAAPELISDLDGIAGRSGFSPSRHVVEVHGRCAECRPPEAER
ncbi:MAG: Fur family transcriptional regulator [Pseudomonadota bacterium]